MALNGPLAEQLVEHLAGHLGRPVRIHGDRPVGGGSINDAYRLDTSEGPFFVKVDPGGSPDMFAAEADGLGRLRATGVVRVPEVIATAEVDGPGGRNASYILLEWVEHGLATESYWAALGRSLAALHRHRAPTFGLERDNYIGRLKQVNTPHDHWAEFFVACRLEPQVRMARDHGRIGDGGVLRAERLFTRVEQLFPPEPPALLHGDLWSGNVLCDAHGLPVLIDPAVYHGHREMDIAMTKLFGGFEADFYSAYNDAWPLETDWEERTDLCNLYPLLVHVNLFGGGYVQQVEAVLKRFV